jgi:hypothetical protein
MEPPPPERLPPDEPPLLAEPELRPPPPLRAAPPLDRLEPELRTVPERPAEEAEDVGRRIWDDPAPDVFRIRRTDPSADPSLDRLSFDTT